MATRNVASKYLQALEDTSPTRSPLKQSLKFNTNTPLKNTKHDSPDLDDLARQMNIEVSNSNLSMLRTRFDSPSATVSSFKISPRKADNYNTSPSKLRPQESIKKVAHSTVTTAPRQNQSSSLVSGGPGYEYLCRIQAIKEWLQIVLDEKILQSPVELISYIRNGIYLAKLANVILPKKRPVYTNDTKLEFRHTENINRFFHLLDYLDVPDLFRFELTDLYDAKDVPKVWYCLHAMSHKINQFNPSYPAMENLVGQLDFSESDIKTATKSLVNGHLPNFSSADSGQPGSPLRNTYMAKTMTLSPEKVVHKEDSSRDDKAKPNENPFTDDKSPEYTASNYRLNSVKKPDLFPSNTQELQSPLKYRSETSLPIFDSFSNALVRSDTSEAIDRNSKYYTPELNEHISNVIMLQALSKGSLFRYNMFVDKIMLKSYDSELTQLYAIIRANLTRKRTVHRHRDELLCYSDNVRNLQALARGKIIRKFLNYEFDESATASISKLQSLIRATKIRESYYLKKLALSRYKAQISAFQSRIRAKDTYFRASTLATNRDRIEDSIVVIQSNIRRFLYQKHTNKTIVSKLLGSEGITQLQSIIRGGKVRNEVRYYLRNISKLRYEIREIQSIARGGILRTRLCNNVLITLMGEDIKMNELFAKVRGNNVRRVMNYKKSVLECVSKSEIIPIQSMFRGILFRFYRDEDLECIYEQIDSITTLQSKIRANFVTSELKSMMDYYNRNVNLVIKAQSYLKSKYTQNAYKSLINMKSPPLSVVRKFAHLLSDSGLDFQEEMELANLKDKIFEKSKNNEELELQIENLDIKLSLLDKNKITIEEFMKHNHKFKTYKPIMSKNVGTNGLDKLSSSAKKRIELYLSMLYFLQTKASYWIRLYEEHPSRNKDKFTTKLQDNILLVFPLAQGTINSHSRVEYFFLKFVSSLMELDIKYCQNVADITKMKNAFWIDFLVDFHSHSYQRMHLKSLIGKVVEAIIDDDELSFESDPAKIYSQLREQDIRAYGSSVMDEGVTAQEAIKDPRVSSAFVSNLMALRDATTDTVEMLRLTIDKLPVHIRFLAKKAYMVSQLHFPDQSDKHHLAVAGAVFIKHYIGSIFHLPENYGFSTKRAFGSRPEYMAVNNLRYLNRVLLQVFSMKPFSDNFMKPLNDYVTSCTENTRSLIREIINVKDLEAEYEMNEYDDIVAHERPQLTMRVADMISIEKLVRPNIDIMAPSADDQLRSVAEKLRELNDAADDYVSLTEMGSYTLTLSPVTKEDSVADSKAKTLFTQAKRCLLYMIRVEEGDDLLELFIHGIKPVHEVTFKEIIASEADLSKPSEANPYRASYLGDMPNMTYVELKKLALKVILQLERMGQVSRKDSFQELLNQIVVDIKTKDKQRINRKEQMEIARQTVRKLEEKERFLKRQLGDYNTHIDEVLDQLQLRPKEKKIFNIIPVFSKQYFYHRQLKKNNRLPKFGSYRYSAKKLLEQNVIRDLGGALQERFAASSKLHFMFSCHKLGAFVIEAADGLATIPGACTTITLDQLLDHQYEKKKYWEMFNGMAAFETENLASLIFRKFYDIKKD